MTPERTTTGEGGTLRFNRIFKGVGRIRSSSGTSDLEEFKVRDAILTKLKRNAQMRVLRAFKDGELSIEQLVEADASGKLKSRALLAEIALRAPLWQSIDRALPEMGKSEATRLRYLTSLKKLRARASRRYRLPVEATVADLRRAKWKLLEREWGASAADWNHLRRAVSAFLTVHLDNVQHPFRRRVVKRIPLRAEKARVPDLSVATFWAIVNATPAHAQPCYITLAATGMRLGEYLACTAAHLVPDRCAIDVPGTKTDESAARIFVDRELWPWIERGVPAPLGARWMGMYWRRACLAVGAAQRIGTGATKRVRVKLPAGHQYTRDHEALQYAEVERTRYKGPTLHDLRHLYAQLADEEGATDTQVMGALRHSNPAQTREYKRRRAAGEVAKMVGNQLLKRLGS